jgi:hypothetical protein
LAFYIFHLSLGSPRFFNDKCKMKRANQVKAEFLSLASLCEPMMYWLYY